MKVKCSHFQGMEEINITLKDGGRWLNGWGTSVPPPHKHTVVTWKLPVNPSLWKPEMRASEEWPRAQASTTTQLHNPGCFKGASLCASKAFYEWEPSWLPTIGCLHKDLFQLLGLKPIWKGRTTSTLGIKCREGGGFKLVKSEIPWYL